jgi:uncharacterized protein YndB with AHSA1/START domain
VRVEVTAGTGLILHVERTLHAPRSVAYRALIDAATLGEWWGPRGFTARAVAFDPRVGGTYLIAMQPPDGEAFHLSGEFRRVEPPARIAYTFRWDPPHPDDRETMVTLTLEDSGEETRLRLTQCGLATEERYLLHENGWSETFERLGLFLASRGEAAPDFSGGTRGRRVGRRPPIASSAAD